MKTHVVSLPTGITTHNKRLQKGLYPIDKAERVYRYAKQMSYEIGVIAHSCGVGEPRRLKRMHCRIVTEGARSRPLDEIYPPANTVIDQNIALSA